MNVSPADSFQEGNTGRKKNQREATGVTKLKRENGIWGCQSSSHL